MDPDPGRREDSRRRLVVLLQLAYSGELAAAYAYRGHWRSVSQAEERDRIRTIEDEEWHHRRLVGDLLQRLGARPDRVREWRAFLTGRVLGLLCHVSGWFAPMYGAGRLEKRNIAEYETAARYAREAGHPEFLDCLLAMAEVEWEHEAYFRSKVESHPWCRHVRMWAPPPSKETIRAAYAERPAERPEVHSPSPREDALT